MIAQELRDMLPAMSDRGLLKAYASLTHRIHHFNTDQKAEDARAQRDIVETEILRRMKK